MQDTSNLEQRVATLERIVAELQSQIRAPSTTQDWLKRIGTVTDVEAFDRAMEYGRQYRNSDTPSDEMSEPA